jgi:hypothetical protein
MDCWPRGWPSMVFVLGSSSMVDATAGRVNAGAR